MISGFRGQYFFLSNFYFCDVEYDGLTYPTAEHAFQAAKCLDDRDKAVIQRLPTPKDAKQYGRKVKLVPNWLDIREEVMLTVVRSKFSDPRLSLLLVSTGTKELVEENQWGDTFWGCVNGIGQNKLGKILMQVRSEIFLQELI